MDSYEKVYLISFLTEGVLYPVTAVASATTENCDLTGREKGKLQIKSRARAEEDQRKREEL